MGVPFDYCADRPEHIETILNGLDRYNPETTSIFQDYVTQQCEDRIYDIFANLALLKLYQFNPHLAKDETITNILVKALTVFPSVDFSLCMHLLPPHIATNAQPQSAQNPPPGGNVDASLPEAVQKLSTLNTLLNSAQYSNFWSTIDGDDLYSDLFADVNGFEELVRVRIAVCIGQSVREVERSVLESWLGMQGRKKADFEKFVVDVCGWSIKDAVISVPVNKENEAKGSVVRENVKFDQFSRMIHRAYEQPA